MGARPKSERVIEVSRSATGVRRIVACANAGGGGGGSIRNAGLWGSGVHGAPSMLPASPGSKAAPWGDAVSPVSWL